MLLIGFDGSEDAKAAITHVAEIAPGAEVTVLTVWAPVVEVLIGSGRFGVHPSNHAEIDAASERNAEAMAAEGAELARTAGLTATSTSRCRSSSIAATIIATARDIDGQAIVVGSRGLSGARSLLVGSVSRDVLHDADRPVVVVPSAAVAAGRTARHSSVEVVL